MAKEKKEREFAEAKDPSFFVIIMHYLAPLAAIDATMTKHFKFLDKYFKRNIFKIAGRQVSRTGGVILAQVNSRAIIETIMQRDPFVKEKLADYEIIEFKASKKASNKLDFK